jgi:hypothetical protein
MAEESIELARVRRHLDGLDWLRLVRPFDEYEATLHSQLCARERELIDGLVDRADAGTRA